jgi:hypothetical protein
MKTKNRLWPCDVDCLTTGVNVEQRPLSAKTISRIAEGMQKFFYGDVRRGPSTKNYWIMMWVMAPSRRKMTSREIQQTIARLQKMSIPEIQEFTKKDSVTRSVTGQR